MYISLCTGPSNTTLAKVGHQLPLPHFLSESEDQLHGGPHSHQEGRGEAACFVSAGWPGAPLPLGPDETSVECDWSPPSPAP